MSNNIFPGLKTPKGQQPGGVLWNDTPPPIPGSAQAGNSLEEHNAIETIQFRGQRAPDTSLELPPADPPVRNRALDVLMQRLQVEHDRADLLGARHGLSLAPGQPGLPQSRNPSAQSTLSMRRLASRETVAVLEPETPALEHPISLQHERPNLIVPTGGREEGRALAVFGRALYTPSVYSNYEGEGTPKSEVIYDVKEPEEYVTTESAFQSQPPTPYAWSNSPFPSPPCPPTPSILQALAHGLHDEPGQMEDEEELDPLSSPEGPIWSYDILANSSPRSRHYSQHAAKQGFLDRSDQNYQVAAPLETPKDPAPLRIRRRRNATAGIPPRADDIETGDDDFRKPLHRALDRSMTAPEMSQKASRDFMVRDRSYTDLASKPSRKPSRTDNVTMQVPPNPRPLRRVPGHAQLSQLPKKARVEQQIGTENIGVPPLVKYPGWQQNSVDRLRAFPLSYLEAQRRLAPDDADPRRRTKGINGHNPEMNYSGSFSYEQGQNTESLGFRMVKHGRPEAHEHEGIISQVASPCSPPFEMLREKEKNEPPIKQNPLLADFIKQQRHAHLEPEIETHPAALMSERHHLHDHLDPEIEMHPALKSEHHLHAYLKPEIETHPALTSEEEHHRHKTPRETLSQSMAERELEDYLSNELGPRLDGKQRDPLLAESSDGPVQCELEVTPPTPLPHREIVNYSWPDITEQIVSIEDELLEKPVLETYTPSVPADWYLGEPGPEVYNEEPSNDVDSYRHEETVVRNGKHIHNPYSEDSEIPMQVFPSHDADSYGYEETMVENGEHIQRPYSEDSDSSIQRFPSADVEDEHVGYIPLSSKDDLELPRSESVQGTTNGLSIDVTDATSIDDESSELTPTLKNHGASGEQAGALFFAPSNELFDIGPPNYKPLTTNAASADQTKPTKARKARALLTKISTTFSKNKTSDPDYTEVCSGSISGNSDSLSESTAADPNKTPVQTPVQNTPSTKALKTLGITNKDVANGLFSAPNDPAGNSKKVFGPVSSSTLRRGAKNRPVRNRTKTPSNASEASAAMSPVCSFSVPSLPDHPPPPPPPPPPPTAGASASSSTQHSAKTSAATSSTADSAVANLTSPNESSQQAAPMPNSIRSMSSKNLLQRIKTQDNNPTPYHAIKALFGKLVRIPTAEGKISSKAATTNNNGSSEQLPTISIGAHLQYRVYSYWEYAIIHAARSLLDAQQDVLDYDIVQRVVGNYLEAGFTVGDGTVRPRERALGWLFPMRVQYALITGHASKLRFSGPVEGEGTTSSPPTAPAQEKKGEDGKQEDRVNAILSGWRNVIDRFNDRSLCHPDYVVLDDLRVVVDILSLLGPSYRTSQEFLDLEAAIGRAIREQAVEAADRALRLGPAEAAKVREELEWELLADLGVVTQGGLVGATNVGVEVPSGGSSSDLSATNGHRPSYMAGW